MKCSAYLTASIMTFDTMKCISLTERDQELFARAALSYRYEYEDKSPNHAVPGFASASA
uniref:Uncharacterized protein n=1 Tax=Serratia marcescens TaxID=615 RepID=A0A1C3HN91_SERMA|nr:Uncharacterised protein [Serratia marcescens]